MENGKPGCVSCSELCCWLSAEEPPQLTCRKLKRNITYIMDLEDSKAKTIRVCDLKEPVQLNIGFEDEEEED